MLVGPVPVRAEFASPSGLEASQGFGSTRLTSPSEDINCQMGILLKDVLAGYHEVTLSM